MFEQDADIYRKIFTKYGAFRTLEANSFLKEKGSAADELWYISKGSVRAFSTSAEGDEITLFYIHKNNVIYVESLAENATIIQEAQAVTPIEFYVLPRERFLEIWEQEGHSIPKLMNQLVERITLLHNYILCSHMRNGSQRVAFLLCSKCIRSGADVPYSQEQIASITGLNRVQINRILRGFAEDGLVEIGYKKISVLDFEKLSKKFDFTGF